MIKKTICAVLTALVTFCSVFFAYEDTVHAFDIPTAFWGTLEASRALWTGLQTGGALQNGISISKFERSSREDMLNFQSKILLAYNGFCVYKEKAKLLLEHPEWTMEQITNEATTRGFNDFTSFKNNAINVNNTTGSITLKDWGYWKEFCSEIKSVAQNGLGSGTIGENTEIYAPVRNDNGQVYQTSLVNYGRNTFVYNDHYYIDRGYRAYMKDYNASTNTWTIGSGEFAVENVPTDRIRIPFIFICWRDVGSDLQFWTYYVDVNRLTGEVIATSKNVYRYGGMGGNSELLNSLVSHTNIPICIGGTNTNDPVTYYTNYEQNLSISGGSGNSEIFQQNIGEALDQTEVGSSIKEGGASIPVVVKENDVPVKRSSVRVGEETATGVIGWDIPSSDVLEGAIAQPQAKEQQDVIEGIGVITVPEENVIEGTVDDTVITWDKAEDITIPGVEDESITTTIDDVISIQGGNYYPGTMDISGFFPFCIPFDIIYLVEKFDVHGANAPIITIPIMYPEIMANQLGTDRYDVIIDFQDFLVLRNILRVFLLIGFIIGLMKFTRDIIRG